MHCNKAVRPGRSCCDSNFIWLQVTLQDQMEVSGEDSEAITTFLESKVERMIQKGRSRAVGGRPPTLPLIRLRVSLSSKQCPLLGPEGTFESASCHCTKHGNLIRLTKLSTKHAHVFWYTSFFVGFHEKPSNTVTLSGFSIMNSCHFQNESLNLALFKYD